MSQPAAPSSRVRRFLPWLALVLGIVGVLYSFSVVAMAASFSVSADTPARHEYWVRVAAIYEIIMGACLLLCVGAAAVLIRRAFRRARYG